jgi:hypothetical protein
MSPPNNPSHSPLPNLLLLPRQSLDVLVLFLYPIPAINFTCIDMTKGGAVAAEKQRAGEREIDWPGPVGEEDEGADGEDVVGRDAVVGV